MAGIRGIRNAIPSKGKSPTGIFSTRGKQKQDGMSGPNMGTLKYAHGNSNDKNGTRSGGGSAAQTKHQPPRKSAPKGKSV